MLPSLIRPCVLLTVSLVLFSTVHAEEKIRLLAGHEMYVDAALGYSIVIPQDWEKKIGFMGTSLAVLSPLEGEGDNFRENVTVQVEKLIEPMEAKQYFELSLENMRKFLREFKEEKTEKISIGKQTAWKTLYSHQMGDVKVSVLNLITLYGLNGYAVACTVAPDNLPTFRSRCEAILASLRLKAPKP